VTSGAPDGDLAPELTVDAFLGGRVEAVQPARGHHRAGLEAVLLAASLDPGAAGILMDLGAGAGVAGFCAAARCPRVAVVLVERDAELVGCAGQALTRPANAGLAGRVRLAPGDIAVAGRLFAGAADEVLINPPFHDEAAASRSPSPARASAHMLGEEGVDLWIGTAAAVLKPRGRMTLIFRADGLALLLAAIGRRFGGLDLLPVQPRAQQPAHRIIVSARKGSRAPLRLLPPLVLHDERGNAFRPEIDAMLRGGAGLDEVHPAWRSRR
jgi:tRNA1(Val) A37 N6-methylase TrmN6